MCSGTAYVAISCTVFRVTCYVVSIAYPDYMCAIVITMLHCFIADWSTTPISFWSEVDQEFQERYEAPCHRSYVA